MRTLMSFLILISLAFTLQSQSYVSLDKELTSVEMIENSETKLVFTNSVKGFELNSIRSNHGEFTRIVIPEYYPDKKIGFPELPVMTKLIELPADADVQINILSYELQTINLAEHGYIQALYPNQVSLFKNQDPKTIPFEKQASVYENFESYSTELVVVEKLGKMRGVQVAQLIVSPFSYDIETNTVSIYNNVEIEVLFKNADISKTNSLKAEKYSPAFESVYKQLWNYKAPAQKDALSKYPIKYVVVADRMFEEALQPFIEWKTMKGFYVVEAYTDEIGSSAADIKTFMQGLYEAGTVDDPAPTYALFVGDVAQVPSNSVSGHVTDMYYCEFDGGGDYFPEMYFGRFSATTVAQLEPQIEKTLMFEQYTFPDPAFLAEVVLVAGDDGTFGPTHGNGQINYAHNYYFNEDHGVIDYTYLYPAAGSQAAAIISDISQGVGLVNYTAHCGSSGWAGPNFTTSDVPGLQNENEYFFSIGNCCQSNKFNDNECFGEALLRASKKGAVVHIGGSNNTMWDEDFYWSVGIASSINANVTYEQSTQAAYDHLFHENDEDPYVAAYQMCYIGNLQVTASTSSQKKYYWEIYHVMGDPSLMPYVGVPNAVEANYLSSLPIGMTSLTVNTEPDAYVAFSIEGELLDAKLADENGIAILEFEALSTVINADIVVTKQFRAPHIEQVMIIPNDNDYDAMLQSIVVPANMVHVTQATFSPTVNIMNLGQINLTSVSVAYVIDDEEPVVIEWEGNLAMLESETVTFDEITLAAGNYAFTAYVANPNGQTDEYPINDQITKNVLVYSGNAKLTEVENPETILCNQNTFQPTVSLKNFDNFELTSAEIEYTVGTITDLVLWEGSLEQNQSVQIIFPENEFPAGSHTIVFTIVSVNEGNNMAGAGNSISKDFAVIENGNLVVLDILTDYYPSENTWDIINNATSEVIYSGGPFDERNTNYNYVWCLGEGCYTFTVYDSFGDGMGGSSWFNPTPGHVSIVNSTTSETILDFQAGADWSSHSVEFCINTTSAEISKSESFSIYPNPSTGIVYIENYELMNKLEVYNNMGQLLFAQNLNENNANIDMVNFSNGIYFIKAYTQSEIITKRIVLKK